MFKLQCLSTDNFASILLVGKGPEERWKDLTQKPSRDK